jgi:SUMO ligase MMS21 Smc5/6 complex component
LKTLIGQVDKNTRHLENKFRLKVQFLTRLFLNKHFHSLIRRHQRNNEYDNIKNKIKIMELTDNIDNGDNIDNADNIDSGDSIDTRFSNLFLKSRRGQKL